MIALLFIVAASGFGTINDDDWPPRRFTHNRTMKVEFATQRRIDNYCGPAGPGFDNVACSDNAENRIVLPNPCRFPRSDGCARIMCHEAAHLNGWTDNHPR